MTDCASPNTMGPPGPSFLPRPICKRYEIGSYGIDENLQLVGTGNTGTLTNVGLRVPFLPTPPFQALHDDVPDTVPGHSGKDRRYLFMLSSFMVGPGQRVRLRGLRQLVSLGAFSNPTNVNNATSRVTEFLQTTPQFAFVDGNITWGVRWIDARQWAGSNPLNAVFPNASGGRPAGAGPLDTSNFNYRFSNGPALLYDLNVGSGAAFSKTTFPGAHINPVTGKPDFYVFLNGYYPPVRGHFYGEGVSPGLAEFYEIRYPYGEPAAWQALDDGIEFTGPGMIAGMCSVRQTDPTSRAVIPSAVPSTFPFSGIGISPEEGFLLNFPSAMYWRVGMSLLIEDYGCC